MFLWISIKNKNIKVWMLHIHTTSTVPISMKSKANNTLYNHSYFMSTESSCFSIIYTTSQFNNIIYKIHIKYNEAKWITSYNNVLIHNIIMYLYGAAQWVWTTLNASSLKKILIYITKFFSKHLLWEWSYSVVKYTNTAIY